MQAHRINPIIFIRIGTGSCSTKHYGREARLSPGDFIICSSCEPYQLKFKDNYQQAVFAMPQQALQDMLQTI